MILRILLAEANAAAANPEDMLFLRDVLTELEGREYWSDWVHLETSYPASWEDAEALLKQARMGAVHIDLLLLDLNLPEPARETVRPGGQARRTAQGAEVFRRARAAAPQVPVVLLVDPEDITLAEFLLREGAQDFLVKSQVDCAPLAHAIRNAMERQRYLESARASVMTDPLTGLLNRSAFLALVERDRKLALATHRRLLVVIAETASEGGAAPEPDNSEGHDTEDRRDELTLVKTAERLRALSGPTDLIARIGERRFAIAVCETDGPVWGGAWTRLQSASEALHLIVGAAEFNPSHPSTLDDLLAHAEHELAPVAVAARR